ncbi:MAG: DNA polymerase III subunit gamma/tau [Phycisphaerales bacterium]
MSYTVLARRYRSKSFDEVVGQEQIARTLQNAITHGRVAHAYLFCGTRGVGKTSTARVFAKALNAPGDQPKDVADAIMLGRDTDVIEIDAASNNGVEQARELIANSIYRPLRGRYKIYIIDEVHMLSTAAFNALLKTMEEPPDHVVFILCTTETHKVPATIQSRCQRFDFRNIPTARIIEHLGAVVKHEGLIATPELLHMVARLGNGSMRDALSLMDRLMASGEKQLTLPLLQDLLGLPDRELVSQLVRTIAGGEVAGALKATGNLLGRGISPEQLLGTLADHFRDLMVICSCGKETDLVELSGELRQQAVEEASHFDAAGLVYMISLCENVSRTMRSSSSSRALLDAAIVRLAMAEKFADVTAVAMGAATSPAANGARAVVTRTGSSAAKKA